MEKWTELMNAAVSFGAKKAAIIPVENISFEPAFRDACAQNFCGMYGRCWMCPPDVGPLDELISKAKQYRHALVFQTVFLLEDSYDIEGMLDAAKRHNDLVLTLGGQMKEETFLCLTAGACRVCTRCSREEGIPCRFPEKATASLEAYGVDVSRLAKACDMNYINGVNTVTYFGAFLFD
jgi:predicted metal-binding protein